MKFIVLVLVPLLAIGSTSAFADGGTLRLSEQGISVFTSPTPPRIGVIDVSVLVQDERGRIRLGVPVRVRAWPIDDEDDSRSAVASSELATNKLLQSAHLDLDHPGRWRFRVRVEDSERTFDLDVAGASSWHPLLPWIGWPFLVVALFGLKIFLLRREPRLAKRV